MGSKTQQQKSVYKAKVKGRKTNTNKRLQPSLNAASVWFVGCFFSSALSVNVDREFQNGLSIFTRRHGISRRASPHDQGGFPLHSWPKAGADIPFHRKSRAPADVYVILYQSHHVPALATPPAPPGAARASLPLPPPGAALAPRPLHPCAAGKAARPAHPRRCTHRRAREPPPLGESFAASPGPGPGQVCRRPFGEALPRRRAVPLPAGDARGAEPPRSKGRLRLPPLPPRLTQPLSAPPRAPGSAALGVRARRRRPGPGGGLTVKGWSCRLPTEKQLSPGFTAPVSTWCRFMARGRRRPPPLGRPSSRGRQRRRRRWHLLQGGAEPRGAGRSRASPRPAPPRRAGGARRRSALWHRASPALARGRPGRVTARPRRRHPAPRGLPRPPPLQPAPAAAHARRPPRGDADGGAKRRVLPAHVRAARAAGAGPPVETGRAARAGGPLACGGPAGRPAALSRAAAAAAATRAGCGSWQLSGGFTFLAQVALENAASAWCRGDGCGWPRRGVEGRGAQPLSSLPLRLPPRSLERAQESVTLTGANNPKRIPFSPAQSHKWRDLAAAFPQALARGSIWRWEMWFPEARGMKKAFSWDTRVFHLPRNTRGKKTGLTLDGCRFTRSLRVGLVQAT